MFRPGAASRMSSAIGPTRISRRPPCRREPPRSRARKRKAQQRRKRGSVARLLVLRGDSLDREIELTGQTVRIGRSPQSDLVLDDAGKSVSRNHAEIRFEGGRYVLIDLESQNGVWVAGSRVPYVVLEPNVVA